MEVKDIVRVEKQRGIASTVKSNDLILAYTGGVERFLRDNQSMGDDWVKLAGERLYRFSGKNTKGDVLGSSTDMGVALATFCPEIPLITGQQLSELYSQAENSNPFGPVYIDFGVQINGEPKINPTQAKILSRDFEDRKIKIGEGRVPNFNQLRLVANKDVGVAYKLAGNACSDNIALVSAYPFETRVGKNGLFRAYLDSYGSWCADDDCLPGSADLGRVVRYGAEVVAPKKSEPTSDLVKTLTDDFIKRF
jgi:hypothetical protein